MHASGHALLAAAGGGLARSLAGGLAPMGALSMDVLGTLGGGDPLLGLAVLGTGAAVVKTVGAALAGAAEARVAGEVGAAVRRDVLARILDRAEAGDGLRAPRHGDHGESHRASSRHTAEDLARLTTHIAEVERGVSAGVLGEARAVVQLVPLALLLVVLAPRLAASAALAMSAFAILVVGTRRALKRAHARAARDATALLGASDEAVRHADLWVTYGATARIRDHLARASARIVDAHARLRVHGAVVSGTSEVLGAVALVVVLGLAGRGLLGAVDHGTLVPFAVAFFMAYRPLRDVVEARIARARGEEALLLAAPEDGAPEDGGPEVAPAAREMDPGRWPLAELTLDGLVGAHGRHAPVRLRVAPGAVVAVVGPTGVGKSSLVRALLGLDRPREGTVSYAGVPITDQPPGPRARPFAWVPQDAPVLAASLAENVALGAASDARALEALALVGGAGLASRPDEMLVVGRKLSGGERQLVAIARALATELPVLVLDEPTSALDPRAQEEVLVALRALRGKRTVLVVTHRPEPLAIADVVVRLAPSAVEGEDSDGRSGLDVEGVAADEVAVDDVRPRAAGEDEPRA